MGIAHFSIRACVFGKWTAGCKSPMDALGFAEISLRGCIGCQRQQRLWTQRPSGIRMRSCESKSMGTCCELESPTSLSSSIGRTDSGFWERIQEAWGVLVGAPSTGRKRLKKRFSRLLVTDRGFDSDSLTHFYAVAKAAISQDVVLDEADEQGATIEKLGELQFQFNVRRIKSCAQDEPWARPSLVEYEPPVVSSD